MRRSHVVAGVLMVFVGGVSVALAQDAPVTTPQPGVPEVFTLQGEFVRLAYNHEGWVTLGYRVANQEVGKEWMLLDIGITLVDDAKPYTLKREAFTVTCPDGTVVPLASQRDIMEAGYLPALNRRAQVAKDSVDYFPPLASTPCRLRFFAPAGKIVFDQAELDVQRACFGRLFFHLPGGIQLGQHWLNVQFASSVVRVPFRTLTEDEEKLLRTKWQDFKEQHEKAMAEMWE